MTAQDFEGVDLGIGDAVVAYTGPNTLQKGIVSALKHHPLCSSIEIVVDQPDGAVTITVAPFLCAKR